MPSVRRRSSAGRSALDIRRLGQALSQAGIDPRHWVSYGTVGVVDDEGALNTSDRRAVYVGPEGVEVDVVLEPLNILVSANYAGLQGGRACTFFTPIRPGDRVLVVLPDGDPTQPPVITAVLHSAAAKVPLSGGFPRWQNDRVFLWAQDTPVDIRTAGGARVELLQNGQVILDEGTKGVARLDDATTSVIDNAKLLELAAKLLATGLFTPAIAPPPPPPQTPINVPGTITAASTRVKSG